MRAFLRETEQPIDEAFLADNGVYYRRLPEEAAGYQPILDDLAQHRGYGTQDEVKLRPDTPNLDAALAKFDGEHLHEDDEVRFILDGEGVFDIRTNGDAWMRIIVERGDLIVVPAGKWHRFELTAAKTIHAVRLFKDPAGWVPVYRPAA